MPDRSHDPAPRMAAEAARAPAMTTPCRSCQTPKPLRLYLCPGCWGQLPPAARRALNQRGDHAVTRLRELHRQVDAGVPLCEVQVTP